MASVAGEYRQANHGPGGGGVAAVHGPGDAIVIGCSARQASRTGSRSGWSGCCDAVRRILRQPEVRVKARAVAERFAIQHQPGHALVVLGSTTPDSVSTEPATTGSGPPLRPLCP